MNIISQLGGMLLWTIGGGLCLVIATPFVYLFMCAIFEAWHASRRREAETAKRMEEKGYRLRRPD